MEIYHDFYGCQACIRVLKSGEVRLTVRSGTGRLICTRDYTTRSGAIRAMGRLSDGWAKK